MLSESPYIKSAHSIRIPMSFQAIYFLPYLYSMVVLHVNYIQSGEHDII